MEVKLLPKTRREVSNTVKEYGYEGEEEFIEDALWHRILDLKKAEFLLKTKAVLGRMKKRGLTEKDVLKDFDKFYHRK